MEGVLSRKEDIKIYSKGAAESAIQKSVIQDKLTDLYASIWETKNAIDAPTPTTGITISGITFTWTKGWPKSKKKKLNNFSDDMQAAWQSLMLYLTMSIASSSSGTAKTVSANLHKLAVASGAPDWEDLTLDDGKSLFLRGEKYVMGLGVPKSYDIAFKSYLAAAKCGNSDSMNMLGVMYETGMGIEKDMSASIKWFKEAAKNNCTEAMNNLGRICESGKGLPQDMPLASTWYLKAAERGNVDAMTNLGFMLENGIGQDPNPSLALEWYRMSAIQGYARGQNSFGSCYYRGAGIDQDYGEAVIWYKKASDQGNAHAQNNLGICYEEGLGVAKDIAMAKTLYKSASDSKHPSGTNNLGYMLLLEGNWVEALKLFHLAWSLGSADAAFNIGTLYENGCSDSHGPILDKNIDMAIRWYQEAAGMDSVKAQVRLGTLFSTVSMSKYHDPDSAITYLRRASISGSADAKSLLGQILALGLGGDGTPNPEEAVELYRSGAEQGHASSLFHLAACYEMGHGVNRDFQKATRMFEEADRLGSEEAKNRLELLKQIST